MRLTTNSLRLLPCVVLLAALSGGAAMGQISAPSPSDPVRPAVSHERALQLLAAHYGRPVVWVGAPPAGDAAVSPHARTLAEVVGEWADGWGAMVILTPDAVFFHAPKTFDHVRPAHFDPLLPRLPVIDLLNDLPRSALSRFPLGATDTPQSFRAESLREAVPLTLLEADGPGFEKGLRELLKQARARARGEREIGGEKMPFDVRLAEAPAEQLYVRLFAETQVYCTAGGGSAQLTFPVSLSKYAVNNPLFVSASALVREAAGRGPLAAVETLRLTAGELIRSGRFTGDDRRGAPIFVDNRLEQIPVMLFLPRGGPAPVWATLEAGLGVERRDLGETIFFGPWMDEDRHRRFSFISRWARANGGLWTALFTPYVARPRRLTVEEIGWQRLETILVELRRRQARGDKEVAALNPREFLAGGRVSLGQAGFLEVLFVGKSEGGAPQVILGRHNFFLD
jgi:hypothetical protein